MQPGARALMSADRDGGPSHSPPLRHLLEWQASIDIVLLKLWPTDVSGIGVAAVSFADPVGMSSALHV